jgi:hypothetical protein
MTSSTARLEKSAFTVMQELGIRHVLTGDAHSQQVGLGFHQLP